MDPITSSIFAAVFSGATIGAAVLYSRSIIRNADKEARAYAIRAENFIDGRTVDALAYIERIRDGWRRFGQEHGVNILALAGERNVLSEMVDELRQERDDLETELAAYKVDSVEQGRIADAYAKQTKLLDDVIDHLTAQLGEARLTVVLPGYLAEAHAEALIRIGLQGRVSRGPATIGRAA
jgi:hypothetical protein